MLLIASEDDTQIFGNLLNNAVKYGQSGGRISVTASSEGEWAREAGFDHHLVKPLDFDALLQVLDEFSASPKSPAQPLEER